MMEKKNKTELLAPAGSYDSLRAAVNAGADAVYAGGSIFGARAFADNFDNDSMLRAIDYIHLHNKKLYLTVNTLLKNSEIEKMLYEYILPLYCQGLDAVIVQDMGVFEFIKYKFPDLSIHASTQMTSTGVHSAAMLKRLGAARVVTARELSLFELKKIHENVNIEIESFIHGAMCYCYSGQCLLSSMLGGRSGNRGRCAQPCRLPFDVSCGGIKNNKNEKYILSLKDMCTIDILPDIIEAGVYSLKIEGRMKSPEYVAGVVEIYRKYIDLYFEKGKKNFKIDKNDYEKLTSLYSRNGFSKGYYMEHNGRDMLSLSKSSYNSVYNDRIEKLRDKYVSKDVKVQIKAKIKIQAGQPCDFVITEKISGKTVHIVGNVFEYADKRSATYDDIKKQLSKFGNTPFECAEINIELDDGLFVPVKALNEMRRQATEKLECAMLKEYRRFEPHDNITDSTDYTMQNFKHFKGGESLEIICSVETVEQFNAVVRNDGISQIYVSLDFIAPDIIENLITKAHSFGKKCLIVMPYIFRENTEIYLNTMCMNAFRYADGFLIKNIDEIEYLKDFAGVKIADYSLYTMNDYAVKFYSDIGFDSCTVPLELNSGEIYERDNQNNQMLVYGYLPLMVTAGCIKKTLNSCDANSSVYVLTDRYKKKFSGRTSCNFCYNLIYNSQPLSLLSCLDEVKKSGIHVIRLNFTFETGEEAENISDLFIGAFINGNTMGDVLKEHTKGHFKRRVD